MRAMENAGLNVANTQWGSDRIADLLRALGNKYIALCPGASFRGLHDSLVNHLGNEDPTLLLCVHEEHSVALAHGYAKVTGEPMTVALHANVGLMHATMAIFNAWCDRVPITMLGAVGPVDARQRRPWVDWIHTSRDLGALIRGYIKWDDQPASLGAALEAIVRANQIARTAPCGPVFVCLDAGLQEKQIETPVELPPLERFRPAAIGKPAPDIVGRMAEHLNKAERPVFMLGRASRSEKAWANRVELAERIGALVVTDLKSGAAFPTKHPLHPFPPGLYINTDANAAIAAADVVLSLDWIDLAGTLLQSCAGELPNGTVLHCSPDQYVHGGWSMDYQGVPPTEETLLCDPDDLVEALLEHVKRRDNPPAPPARKQPGPTPSDGIEDSRMTVEALARSVIEALEGTNHSFVRLSLGWPGEWADFRHPLDYLGYDGGGGIGSGPGMAVGSALALRDGTTGRLPVAVIGDGDYLMGLTALWTAVRYDIPLLLIVANNQSFFNDELHQERMARVRGRPVENRWIGLRLSEPGMDLAQLAVGQGARGVGPVMTPDELKKAVSEGIKAVRDGAVYVIDAHVRPEYARAVSSALLRDGKS